MGKATKSIQNKSSKSKSKSPSVNLQKKKGEEPFQEGKEKCQIWTVVHSGWQEGKEEKVNDV